MHEMQVLLQQYHYFLNREVGTLAVEFSRGIATDRNGVCTTEGGDTAFALSL